MAHAQADLKNCMAEAASQEIVNGVQALNCTDMSGNLLDCTVTIHVSNGTVSLSACANQDYHGFAPDLYPGRQHSILLAIDTRRRPFLNVGPSHAGLRLDATHCHPYLTAQFQARIAHGPEYRTMR